MIKTYKFDELYEMSSGISSKPEQAGHGAPFLSFGTIFNNYFLPDDLPDLMNASSREKEVYSIKKGDIFITRTSETLDELAMSSVALKDYPSATFSGFSKRLRPIKDNVVYDKYMGFYLRSRQFRQTINNNAIMTLRASFNEQIFSYLKLSLPDYETQIEIGNFLYDLEKLKQVNLKMNCDLELLSQTIYDYWFVQFEFPNDEGKPYKSSGGAMVWNEEMQKDIPDGWKVKSLEQFGDFKNGINYEKESSGDTLAKIINVRNVSNSTYFISKSELDTILLPFNSVNKYLVTDNDIIIARSGIPGATRLLYEYEKNTIYCGFIIRFNVSDNYMRNFLFYNLKSLESLTTQKSGGTIMKNVNQETLKTIKLVNPPCDKIKSFNSIIDNIFKTINNNTNQNSELIELREWLIPMFTNGQVDLTNNLSIK